MGGCSHRCLRWRVARRLILGRSTAIGGSSMTRGSWTTRTLANHPHRTNTNICLRLNLITTTIQRQPTPIRPQLQSVSPATNTQPHTHPLRQPPAHPPAAARFGSEPAGGGEDHQDSPLAGETRLGEGCQAEGPLAYQGSGCEDRGGRPLPHQEPILPSAGLGGNEGAIPCLDVNVIEYSNESRGE